MSSVPFDRCVFINCPFDEDYEEILQAVFFCIVYAGMNPRIAKERDDSSENRLQKIIELIRGSKYSIHDLSRCQATEEGEPYRLNMPFELGVDYGCKTYAGSRFADKKILILEEKRFRYQAAISDLAGCDIQAHESSYAKAVRKVRNWIVSASGIKIDGANKILSAYYDFQAWYYEKQHAAGHSEEDIRDYSTPELLEAMKEWVDAGKPI